MPRRMTGVDRVANHTLAVRRSGEVKAHSERKGRAATAEIERGVYASDYAEYKAKVARVA
jgi:hypothetical protein